LKINSILTFKDHTDRYRALNREFLWSRELI
jgi:hypothetical protein